MLDASEGLVMCNTAIDSQAYNNYILNSSGSYYYGDSAKTHYASDYANSSIRAWLNNDFYNTAFTAVQQGKIKTTTCDNSSPYNSAYNSATTYDKVFLLSYNDVLNSSYGFSSSDSTYDTARRLKSTDYAKSQGCYANTDTSYLGNSWWWLRSPGNNSDNACEVYSNGGADDNSSVNSTDRGVIPALKISNLTSEISESFSAESNKIQMVQGSEDGTPTRGAQTSAATGTVTCRDAVDGNLYMLYAIGDYTEDVTLTTDNLYYINQAAGENGTVKFDCKPKQGKNLTLIVVGDFGSGIEAKIVTANPIEESKNVTAVSVDDIKMNYKKSTTITPNITADEGAEYTVTWLSSNEKVATVDENGNVYAAKTGSAVITCTVTDTNGNTVTDDCTVTVKYSFGQWLIKILLFGWIWY